MPLLAELGQGGEAGPARDAAAAEASLKALGMERRQALIVSHRGRATPRACDREPGGPGERQGGGVEPEQAAPLEVGGKV